MINVMLEGLVKLILIIAIIGIVLGLMLSNTELLNPKRAQVETMIMEQKASVEAQRRSIELEAYRKEQEIRLKGLQQREEESLAYQRALHQVTLELLMTGGTIIAVGIALGLAALGIGKAFSLATTASESHKAYQKRTQELQAVVQRLIRANRELEREVEHLRRKLAESTEMQGKPLWEEAEKCAAQEYALRSG